MRTKTGLGAIAAVALAGALAFAGDGGKIDWQRGKDLDEAIKEAKAQKKHLLVYFTADW